MGLGFKLGQYLGAKAAKPGLVGAAARKGTRGLVALQGRKAVMGDMKKGMKMLKRGGGMSTKVAAGSMRRVLTGVGAIASKV